MLENLIFDLDGTLWQTTNSYPYAYHKLCEHYGTPEMVSDDYILTCLGVKLDKFLPKLFPTVNFTELAFKAMAYSLEYVLAHPQGCCFEGVRETLEELSQKYNIYIVSNCLDDYVEAFMNISGTRDFIKGYYTIQSGEKCDNISKIIKASKGKTLLVGDSDDDYLAISDPYSVLFCFASYGYKECSGYAYKIDSISRLSEIVERLEIKERQLQGKRYRVIARGDNQLTLIENSDGSKYFGFINHADDNFEAVVNELATLCKRDELIGPIDSNTFYSYRFAIDEFDWRLYPDCQNSETTLRIFEEKGFKIKQLYTSTLGSINEKIWDLAKKTKLPDRFRVVEAKGEGAYEYLSDIYEIAVESFAEADFYEPISESDFTDIYIKNLAAVTPNLTMIYEGDTPVAFNFCYPDPENRFYVCKTIAIKKDYRNRRIIMKLIDLAYSAAKEQGFSEVLYHFQNDRTKSLYAIFKDCQVRQKRYALMELTND